MLLEVLAAFAIAALGLASLVQADLSGLTLVHAAAGQQQAIARARSHIVLAINAVPLQPGEWLGNDGGGFSWRLRVTPVAAASIATPEALAREGSETVRIALYSVTVVIGWRDWGGQHRIRLATEHIGPAAP